MAVGGGRADADATRCDGGVVVLTAGLVATEGADQRRQHAHHQNEMLAALLDINAVTVVVLKTATRS
jgi:hypothetical protein